jgi:hypothetical protein
MPELFRLAEAIEKMIRMSVIQGNLAPLEREKHTSLGFNFQ